MECVQNHSVSSSRSLIYKLLCLLHSFFLINQFEVVEMNCKVWRNVVSILFILNSFNNDNDQSRHYPWIILTMWDNNHYREEREETKYLTLKWRTKVFFIAVRWLVYLRSFVIVWLRQISKRPTRLDGVWWWSGFHICLWFAYLFHAKGYDNPSGLMSLLPLSPWPDEMWHC